ncbi:MAG: hypothetical protein GKS05_10645 [Nitrospirales bacterium]|nr:hypothetical protein [Nitrospirales bacterium]
MKPMVIIIMLLGTLFLPIHGPAQLPHVGITMDMHEPFYSPSVATLYVGQTIQWYNQSGMPHTITHDGCIRRGACAFESGPVSPGNHFTLAHLTPGTYSYHCSIHPFMRGRVIVKGSMPRYSHDL